MFRKILGLSLLVVGITTSSSAQDPLFTQPMSNFTQLNPALTGKDQYNTLFYTYRLQWPEIAGTYVTNFLGYYHYASKLNAYWGGDFMNDNAGAGTLITSRLALNYAQNIKLGSLLFRPAIRVEYIQKSLDYTMLTFGDQIDQQYGFISSTDNFGIQTIYLFNCSAGFLASWKGINIGYATHNFLEPRQSFTGDMTSKLPMRINALIDKTFSLKIKNQDFLISPYVFLQKQRDFEQFVYGLNFQYWKIILGGSYRIKDSVHGILGFKTKYFSIIYSYDFTISKLSANTAGSHELGIQFKPFQKKKKAHKNLVPLKSAFLL